MKGTLNEIWKCMVVAHNRCSADEEIGYRAAMRYLHFLIGKSESHNAFIQAKMEVQAYSDKHRKTVIRNSFLEDKVQKLCKRINELENVIGAEHIIKRHIDGFLKVTVEIENGDLFFWVKGSVEEINEHFEAACLHATPPAKVTNKIKFTKDKMISYYRKQGFEAK